MDLDEWIFASLKAWNKKWAEHACDLEAVEEMKEEIALQKAQIADQQEELMLQKNRMAKQNDEIVILRETLQKLLESHAAAQLHHSKAFLSMP